MSVELSDLRGPDDYEKGGFKHSGIRSLKGVSAIGDLLEYKHIAFDNRSASVQPLNKEN